MKFFNEIATNGLGIKQDILKQSVIPLGQAQLSIYANPLNGNVVINDFSKTFVQHGFSFDIGYQYNSQSKIPWRLNQGKTIRSPQGQPNTLQSVVIVEESDGHESTYIYDEILQCYVNLAANKSATRLTYTPDGQWISWDPLTNVKEFYNTNNQLEKICDASGNYLSYQYDDSGRLNAICGKSSNTISIEYDGQTVSIYSLAVDTLLKGSQKKLEMQYQFDDENRLENTIIPLSGQENYVIHYDYALDSKCLSCITQSDTTEVHFGYEKIENRYQLHAISQDDLSQNNANTYLFNYQKNNTLITDILGNQEQFAITNKGLLERHVKISGPQKQSQTYDYDLNGRIQATQYEDGSKQQISYDAFGCCSQSIQRNGETKRFYRNPANGLLQCETQVLQHGADSVYLNTFYCYNDKQELVYKISPNGAVDAFLYDAHGNCVSQKSFRDKVFNVSHLSQDSTILTSAVSEWCRQQNQAAITLTEWTYNDLGQKISETTYANINPYGAGIDDEAAGNQQFARDQHGNLLGTQTRLNMHESAINTVNYDGLGRPVTENNPLGETKHRYEDNQHQTIFVPTGLTTTTTWNKSGNVINQTSLSDNVRSENWLIYDTAGRVCIIEKPNQIKEYTVYDALDRPLFTIDASHRVIQYLYDSNDHLTHQLHYSEPITPLTPMDEEALKKGTWNPTLTDNYCIQSMYYDPCGRLHHELNGDNFLTEHRYDTVGNRIETIVYATPLNRVQREKADLSIESSDDDRHHRYFYNEANFLIGEQWPSGHVVAYTLNPQGEILKKRTTLGPMPRLNTWYLDEATPVAEEKFLLDARGQCLSFSNTEQHVTIQTWDAAGRQLTQTLGDETIVYAWDAYNRKTQESHSTGLTIHQTYALCGKIASKTQLDSLDKIDNTDNTDIADLTANATRRSSYLRYNGLGQLTQELSPRVAAKLNNPTLAADPTFVENLWRHESIQHQYDQLGLKISTQDEQNNITYFYYNTAQELRFTISPTGALTEFTYDPIFQKINSTRYYSNIIDLTGAERTCLTGGILTSELTAQFHAKQCPDDAVERIDYNLRGLRELEVDPEQYMTKIKYDAFNNPCTIERQIDSDRVVIDQIEYDQHNRPIKKTQDVGGIEAVETWEYVDLDNLIIHTDANHHTDKTYLDTLKRTIKTVDPLGNETQYSWDALSRPTKTTDPEGNTTEFTYENHGRKIIRKTPLSISITEKNAFSQIIREQNADQAVWQKFYDVDGQVKTTIDPNGNEQHYRYNNAGWLIAVVDPLQHMTCYEHNQSGQIIKQINKALPKQTEASLLEKEKSDLENGQSPLTDEREPEEHFLTFHRDAQGREILRIDANGIKTKTIYDKRGLEIAKIIDPENLALCVSHVYDGLKNSVKEIKGDSKNLDQLTIQIRRDNLGRALGKIIDPSGIQLTTHTLHNKTGHRIATTDSNNHTLHYCFDAANRERYLIDPMGGVIAKTYDKNGRCIEERHYMTALEIGSISNFTLANIETLITPSDTDKVIYRSYTGDNTNETARLDNFGQLTTYCYNAQGQKTHETQYASPIKHADFISNLRPVKSAQDRKFTWFYDNLGNERFAINGEGIVTENRWNEKSWLIEQRIYATPYFDDTTCPNREKLLHPDDRATHYIHDQFGRVVFEINAENYVTEYGYDTHDKPITTWSYPDKIAMPQAVTLGAIRNLLPSHEGIPTTHMEYDAANRKIASVDALKYRETFELDALNNLRNYIDKGGDKWTYDFDTAGRKITESTPPVKIATVSADGQLTLSDTLQRVMKKIEYLGDIERITEAYDTPDARTIELQHNACQKVTHTLQHNVLVDDPFENEPINDFKTKTLTTTTRFNAFQKPIVTIDEAGNAQFKVYIADQLRYEVDQEGFVTAYDYNLFGNVIKLTRHAIALDPHLMTIASIAMNGLSLSDMVTHIQDADQDRHLYFEYDNANRPTKTTQDAVWIYSPQKESDAKYGQFSPVTINEYNTFGETCCERKLVDPLNDTPDRQWDVTRKWFNHAGHQTAEINGLNYLTTFTPDRHGNNETIIEYAKQLIHPLHPESTLTDIVQTQILDPEQDRVFNNQFDARGDLVKTIQKNVQLYDNEAGFDPSLISGLGRDAKQSIETSYVRNAKGLITQEILPNGAIKKTHYDARKLPILKTEPPRHIEQQSTIGANMSEKHRRESPSSALRAPSTRVRGERKRNEPLWESELVVTPVTTTAYNALAQPVCIIRHANPYENEAYLEQHPDDQQHLMGYDTRGLQMVSVDPEGAVRFQRFTEVKKLARLWLSVTGWGEHAATIKRLHQTTRTYDKRGIESGHCESIEGGDAITTAILSNAFGEKIAEGSGDGLFPMYWLHDKTGAVWNTNEQSGVPTIILHNAQGQETATLRSRTQALQDIDNDTALLEMLTWDYRDLQRFELFRNVKGHIEGQSSPAFKTLKPDTPEPYLTEITNGSFYPQFGPQSLSWPTPKIAGLSAKVSLWPQGGEKEIQSLTPVTHDGRAGVDVSQLPTDNYQYQIDFYYTDPQTGQQDGNPRYRAEGSTFIITETIKPTPNIIWHQIDDQHLMLYGNVENVSGVELLDAGQSVARVSVNSTDKPNCWMVDLSDQPSGHYTFRLLYGYSLLEETPLTVGVPSANGSRIDFIHTELNHNVRLNCVNLDAIVTSSWHNLPPQITNLKQTLTAINATSTVPPGRSTFTTYFMETDTLDVSIDNVSSEKTLHNQLLGGLYSWARFSSTISQNKLFTVDEKGTSWLVAEMVNPLHHIANPNPSYLYVQPGRNIPRVDALREQDAGSATKKTINMSTWLNQSSRCIAADSMRDRSYELISLNASVPGNTTLGMIITHTTNLQSNRLMVREIPLKQVSSSKISTIFDQPMLGGYHQRDALNYQWTLPDDLNTHLLKVNVQLNFSDPAYIQAYGTQYRFEYLVGKSNTTPFNGHLLPEYSKSPPGFSRFELAHLNLQLQWGNDWIPILDSRDFTTDRTLNRKPFSFVLPLTSDKNVTKYFSSNEYIEGDISSFPETYTLLFYPLPPSIVEFEIQYWDTTLPTPDWQPLANAIFTGHAIAAPAGPIPIGTYQYRIKAQDANKQPIALAIHTEAIVDGWTMGEMTIKHGGSLSVVSKSILQEEVVKPFRQQTCDRWENITSTTTASGHTTHTQYNGRNLPLTKTEPSIEVTEENGTQRNMTPKTEMAYDCNDQVIAVSDPNQHVMIHERDNDGTTLKTIRADGVFKIFIPDIFGRTKTIRDPLHHDTNYRYDRCNRETLRIDACLWETLFSYNEESRRLSETNGNGETQRYDYLHPGGQPTHHYLPGGDHYLTQKAYDRNLFAILEILPDGRKNKWKTDFFGNVLSHVDLGGVEYTYIRNVFYPSELSKVKSHEGPLSSKTLAKRKMATLSMTQTAAQTSKTRQNELVQYQTTSVRKLLYRIKDYITHSTLTQKRQEIADLLAALVFNLSNLPNAKTDKLLLNLIEQLEHLRDKNNQISRAHGKRENSGRLHKQIESFLKESHAIHALKQSIDNHGGHGARLSLDGTTNPMPSQNITYQHDEASHLVAILDDALPLRTFYRIDIEERRARETFIGSNGHIYQAVLMKWNPLNWLIEVQDTILKVNYSQDPKGNRRSTIAKIYFENGWNTIGDENWYTYTAADNIHINRGTLKNGEIQVSSKQGSMLLYDIAGRRHHELTMNPTSAIMVDKTLFYLDNDHLCRTESTNGEINHYGYDAHVARRSIFSTLTTTQTNKYDINSRVFYETFQDTAKHVHSTTTLELDELGLTHLQTTRFRNDEETDGYDERISTHFVEFDTDRSSEVTGTQQRVQGGTTQSTLKVGFDPNGFTEVVLEDHKEPRSFITNSEGRIVEKMHGHDKKESYFYTADNDPLGRYGNIPQDLLKSALRKARKLTSDDINADFDLNYHPVSEHFPPPTPTTCVVVLGDTFERIAERLYGDKSFGHLIADVNGYGMQDRPSPGMSLQIPSIVNTNLHNWQGLYPIYNPAAIVGSLYPNIPMPSRPIPQPKHVPFWHIFVEAILGTMLMAFAPELAGALAGVLGQLLGQGLGFALAGAASSLTQQGLALGFGDQHGLSWKALGESALLSFGTAGIAKGIGMDLTKMPQYHGFLEAATKNIELTLLSQGLSYATGQQRHFDWRVMLASIANTLANVTAKQIDFGAEAFNDAVATASATVTSIGIDELLGQRIDSETIAANTLGTFIGNQIAAEAKQYFKSYQEQKKLDAQNAQDFQNQFHIPEISESLEESKRDFIQSVKAYPHAHGVTAYSTPSSQANTQPSGRGNHPPSSGKVTHVSQPMAPESPNHHLKAERAEQEARMSRSSRWNEENHRTKTQAPRASQASQHGFWRVVEEVADSHALSVINQVGDKVAQSVLDMVNPVKLVNTALADANDSIRAFRSGEILHGIASTAHTALDVLAFVPLEGAVARGVGYGARGAEALVSRTGWFGGKTASNAERFVMREGVLGHIAASKEARNTSNFAIYGAKEDQILAGYNADTWSIDLFGNPYSANSML